MFSSTISASEMLSTRKREINKIGNPYKEKLREHTKVLDQGTERVTMGSDKNFLPCADLRDDRIMP